MDSPNDLGGALRIEARFKNARLYNAIADRAIVTSTSANGIATQQHGPIKPFCDIHGINVQRVYALLNLKESPLWVRTDENGAKYKAPRNICITLARILELDVQWLFPAELYEIQWPTLAADIDPSQFKSLAAAHTLSLPPAQSEALERAGLRHVLLAQLDTLTPRERKVLMARYGFSGPDDSGMTYEEVGVTMSVTRERIRQIEAKALRKLRHRSRSAKIIEAVNGKPELV